MPWKETQKTDQRMEFVMKALEHPNFRELCREYGVGAKKGYKWRERFIQHGLVGLNELSRRPHGHADELVEAVVCAMVRLKQAHPHWGPRKIQALYQRKHGGEPEADCRAQSRPLLREENAAQRFPGRRCEKAPGACDTLRLGRILKIKRWRG